jgi:universal stress protein A
MREFKTILCPTDFSEDSYRALDYGVRFAKAADGVLLIVHVIHIASGELTEHGHTMKIEAGQQRAQSMLEEARQKYANNYPKCELVLDLGNPYEKLMAIIAQRKVDLVVMSTHGSSGLRHLIMGSVAERLIQHAPCPVFVVRRGAA